MSSNLLLITILQILVAHFDHGQVKAQPYDGVLMKDYTDDYYRGLTCNDCFSAEGRMCHHKDYVPEYTILKEADAYRGVCCKPDGDPSTGDLCSNDPSKSDYICSMNSIAPAETKYEALLTKSDNRNYMFWAFCPLIRQKFCGISDQDDTDVTLPATLTVQKIATTDMFFKKRKESMLDPVGKEYDFCHYIIKLSNDKSMHNFEMALADTALNAEVEKIRADSKSSHLTVQVNKMQQMNVYLYEGLDRLEAKSIITDNEQVTAGQKYLVDGDGNGLILVAYPNEKQTTDFEFEYQALIDLPNCGNDVLEATKDLQTFTNDKIVYRAQTDTTKYDICHYDIYSNVVSADGFHLELSDTAENQRIKDVQINSHSSKLRLKIKKADQMDVLVFSGTDQYKITEELPDLAGQKGVAALDTDYYVWMDKRLIIVTYPKKDQTTTSLEFDYWMGVDFANCGSTGEHFEALAKVQNFQTKGLKGTNTEYDFCHYDIKVNTNDPDTKAKIAEIEKQLKKPKLMVKATKKLEMNVYLYAGVAGSDVPTLQVIKSNNQPQEGDTFQIDIDQVLFIVAYPVINQQTTEFDMEYWIDEEVLPPWEPDNSYLNDNAQQISIIQVGIGLGGFFGLLVIFAFLCFLLELCKRYIKNNARKSRMQSKMNKSKSMNGNHYKDVPKESVLQPSTSDKLNEELNVEQEQVNKVSTPQMSSLLNNNEADEEENKVKKSLEKELEGVKQIEVEEDQQNSQVLLTNQDNMQEIIVDLQPTSRPLNQPEDQSEIAASKASNMPKKSFWGREGGDYEQAAPDIPQVNEIELVHEKEQPPVQDDKPVLKGKKKTEKTQKVNIFARLMNPRKSTQQKIDEISGGDKCNECNNDN